MPTAPTSPARWTRRAWVLRTGAVATMAFGAGAGGAAPAERPLSGDARDGWLPPAEVRLLALEDGRAIRLHEQIAGRPAVLNLWASWCVPCREELPDLVAAEARHAGVRFWYVNQGESDVAIRRFLRASGLPLRRVLLDLDRALGPALGLRALPCTLFFDADGRLFDVHLGLIRPAALEAQIARLLAAR